MPTNVPYGALRQGEDLTRRPYLSLKAFRTITCESALQLTHAPLDTYRSQSWPYLHGIAV